MQPWLSLGRTLLRCQPLPADAWAALVSLALSQLSAPPTWIIQGRGRWEKLGKSPAGPLGTPTARERPAAGTRLSGNRGFSLGVQAWAQPLPQMAHLSQTCFPTCSIGTGEVPATRSWWGRGSWQVWQVGVVGLSGRGLGASFRKCPPAPRWEWTREAPHPQAPPHLPTWGLALTPTGHTLASLPCLAPAPPTGAHPAHQGQGVPPVCRPVRPVPQPGGGPLLLSLGPASPGPSSHTQGLALAPRAGTSICPGC